MQTAERPQHAPDHLQSQTVKLGKLVKEQRVHRPEKRREKNKEELYLTLLSSSSQGRKLGRRRRKERRKEGR